MARSTRWAACTLLLAGCVLGFRGEGTFFGEHDLDGIDTVSIDLPSTPLTVSACDHTAVAACPAQLSYDGRWMSTGGTRSDAEENTTRPQLRLDREGAFAALRAIVPLSVRGLVDLQMGEIVLPDDRDLEIRTTLGDVSVTGTIASVIIDVDIGHVRVRGADAGLGVQTGLGDIDARSPGHVDLRTEEGDVTLVQTGDPRDVVIDTGEGHVLVELADDANVDLRIRTEGTIRVNTARMTTITSGRYERRLGTGAVLVDLRSGHGRIEVVRAR
jgi:hypothetical protein